MGNHIILGMIISKIKMKREQNKKFLVFKKECERLIKEFGLSEWNVKFVCKDYIEEGNSAKIETDSGIAAATIYFGVMNHKDLPEIEAINSARHEICHLLLGKISDIAYKRFVTRDELYKEEEMLVERLLKIIFKDE